MGNRPAPPTVSTSTQRDRRAHGGRMYQLVREHDTVRERTLQITFGEPGVEAYAFTFG